MGKQQDKLAKQQKSVLNRKHIKPITKSEKRNKQLKQRGNTKNKGPSAYETQMQELLERAHGKKSTKKNAKSNEIILKPATLQIQEQVEEVDEFDVIDPRMPQQHTRPPAQRLQRMQSNIFDSLEEIDDGKEEDMTKYMFPLKQSVLSSVSFSPRELDDPSL